MFEAALLTFVGAAAIAGAAYDLTTSRFPTGSRCHCWRCFRCWRWRRDLSLSDAGVHFAIGAVALALGIALFAGGIIGGGDAKLFAALALYMGVQSIGPYVFAVALAGGALAVVLRGSSLAAALDFVKPAAVGAQTERPGLGRALRRCDRGRRLDRLSGNTALRAGIGCRALILSRRIN